MNTTEQIREHLAALPQDYELSRNDVAYVLGTTAFKAGRALRLHPDLELPRPTPRHAQRVPLSALETLRACVTREHAHRYSLREAGAALGVSHTRAGQLARQLGLDPRKLDQSAVARIGAVLAVSQRREP